MSTPPILMSMIQAAPTGQPGGATAFMVQFFPLILIVLIMWFIVFRPQQQRVKQHQAAIAAVKKGDDIVTGGGVRGRVTKVTDDEVEVEIAQGVRVRVVKSTISQVLTPNTTPAND